MCRCVSLPGPPSGTSAAAWCLSGRKNSMLEARSLTKYFNHTMAVKDVSFRIRPGEILGYLGPNGAGKSTRSKCSLA